MEQPGGTALSVCVVMGSRRTLTLLFVTCLAGHVDVGRSAQNVTLTWREWDVDSGSGESRSFSFHCESSNKADTQVFVHVLRLWTPHLLTQARSSERVCVFTGN